MKNTLFLNLRILRNNCKRCQCPGYCPSEILGGERFKTNGEVCDVTKVEDKLDDSYQVCRRPYINKSDRSLRGQRSAKMAVVHFLFPVNCEKFPQFTVPFSIYST